MEAIKSLLGVDLWFVAKIFCLIGLFVYLIFSFVVVRQVKLMTEVVSGVLGMPLKFIAWLFFLFSLFVFIIAVLAL